MPKAVAEVSNMSCVHCVRTIEEEVSEIPGVKAVRADLESGQVVVEWDIPAAWQIIAQTLEEIGHPVLRVREAL